MVVEMSNIWLISHRYLPSLWTLAFSNQGANI